MDEPVTIFDKFKRKTLVTRLKEDLANRVRFESIWPVPLIVGFICRSKKYVRAMKLYVRSSQKISNDMDILSFINTQRRHNASLFGLMTKN